MTQSNPAIWRKRLHQQPVPFLFRLPRASTALRFNCTRTQLCSTRNAMNEPVTIPKLPVDQSESLDYALLRKNGIDYITALGSDFWTDFNIHDPGITLLEALCYALTDLAYRTSF